MVPANLAPRGPSRAPLAVAVIHSSPEIFAGSVAAIDWARGQGAAFTAVVNRTFEEAATGLGHGRDPVVVMFVAAPRDEPSLARLRGLCASCSQLLRVVVLQQPDEEVSIALPFRRMVAGRYGEGDTVAGYLGHLMEAWYEREALDTLTVSLDLLASVADQQELFRLMRVLIMQMAYAFHIDIHLVEDVGTDGWPTEVNVSISHDENLGDAVSRLALGGAVGQRLKAAAAGKENIKDLLVATSDAAPGAAKSVGVTDFEQLQHGDRWVWLSRGSIAGRSAIPAMLLAPVGRAPEEMNAVLTLARQFFATFVSSYAKAIEVREHRTTSGDERRQEAMHEMVCGIAHEIKTPLGVVNTASAVIRNLLHDSRLAEALKGKEISGIAEDMSSAASLIQGNATRISDLIDRFKRVSVKQTVDQIEAVNITECVREAIEANRSQFGNVALTINLIFSLEKGSEIWIGYPKQLAQIIINLLNNAFHHGYGGNGGPVEIALHGRMAGWKAIYSLSVTDYGAGIQLDQIDKIFDAFFTTRRNDRYAGLGLTVVHSLITEMLRGHIGVNSEPGRGTTFHLEFSTLQ